MRNWEEIRIITVLMASGAAFMACANTGPERVCPESLPAPGTQCPPPAQATTPPASSKIEVLFSPRGGCQERLGRLVGEAKTTVRVLAYGFTSKPFAASLVEAASRGADVQVVLDSSNVGSKFSAMGELVKARIPVWIDSSHAIMHDKVVIVNGTTVETGSFNFTAAAEESNAENCLFVQDDGLAASYAAEWEKHRSHSRPATAE
jgi:phosphatidylserine/phosphatidylglycerophosphate/cardiolipin synthase-like enzyme